MTVLKRLCLWLFIMVNNMAAGQNYFVVCDDFSSKHYIIIDDKGKKIASVPEGWEPHLVRNKIGFFEGGVHTLKKEENGKDIFCLTDTAGRIINPELTVDAYGQMQEGLISVQRNGRTGFMDITGKLVIPLKYEWFPAFKNGVARVVEKNKRGLIDKQGNYIIPPKYREISEVSEGMIYVRKGRKEFGFFDVNGKLVIPFTEKYSIYSSGRVFKNGLFRVKGISEKLYGFLDKKGALQIPLQFETARDFENGISLVKKNGLFGYIDTTGAFIISPAYSAGQPFFGNAAWVKDTSSQLWGQIDINGNYLVKPFYVNFPVRMLAQWLISTKEEDRLPEDSKVIGYIDVVYKKGNTNLFNNDKGKVVLKIEGCYDVRYLNDQLAIIKWERGKESNHYSIINKAGELVWQPDVKDFQFSGTNKLGFFSKKEVLNLDLRKRGYYRTDKEKLPTFSPELWTFSNLKALNLEGQFIMYLPPEISRLKKLETLNLHNCKLEVIPKEIFQLKSLKVLNLSYNRDLKKLPKGFLKKMQHLEELNIAGCGFSPDEFYRIRKKLKTTEVIYK